MPLETSWPMTTDFRGVPSLQANGSTGTDGDDSPEGIDGRLEIVPDPAGVYGSVMRATLYETDAEVGEGVRSEIAQRGSTHGATFTEYWYCFKFKLSEDWPSLSEPFTIAQLHDTPDIDDVLVKTPNFIFCLKNGHFRCIVPGQLPTENQVFNYVGSVGADRGVWHDVCIHALWAKAAPTGFRECFVDGIPIYREHGIYTSYDDAKGPFFKLGIYHGLNATAGWVMRRAYFSDVRIWSGAATYEQGLNRQIAQPRRLTKL